MSETIHILTKTLAMIYGSPEYQRYLKQKRRRAWGDLAKVNLGGDKERFCNCGNAIQMGKSKATKCKECLILEISRLRGKGLSNVAISRKVGVCARVVGLYLRGK